MKTRVLSIVLVLAMVLTTFAALVSSADETPNYPFTDVPDWAIGVVNTVYEKGIMNGTGATTFGPEGSFTREQIAATLYRLSGATDEGTAEELAAIFADAGKVSSWAVKEVKWAYESGITTGITAGDKLNFDPQGTLTREQAATMIMRYIADMGISVPTDNEADIKDLDTVSGWALDNVKASIAAGIITGDQNGYFNPQGATNRISAAAMLARIPEAKGGYVPDYRIPSKDPNDPSPENIGYVKLQSGINVADGFKLSYTTKMDDADPNGNEYTSTGTSNHGWHENRIVRNEYGTYIVFVQDEVIAKTGYYTGGTPNQYTYAIVNAKFMLVRVTDKGFEKVHEGTFPVSHGGNCGPNVLAGEDGMIYVTTYAIDPETYLGSDLVDYAAFLGIHEFDTKTNTIVNVTTDVVSFENADPDFFQIDGVPRLSVMNPDKQHPMLDAKNGKIYALFGNGGKDAYGYVSWFIYDIETHQWEQKNYNAEVPQGYVRFEYFNLFPDGNGGLFGVAGRTTTTEQLNSMFERLYGQTLKFNTSGYIWDAVYLFRIPDMHKEELIIQDELYQPDYFNRGLFPEEGGKITCAVANLNNGGATFLASNGYLYVVFNAQGNDRLAVYDTQNNFKKVKSVSKLSFVYTGKGSAHYQFTIGENMDGEVFLVAIDDSKANSELELYKIDINETKGIVPMITNDSGKAASIPFMIKGTTKGMPHSRFAATTTRCHSIQDNILGIVTVPFDDSSTNRSASTNKAGYDCINTSGSETYSYYYYSIELPHAEAK